MNRRPRTSTLDIVRAHIHDCAPDWRHDHAFPDWDLWTVISGACVQRVPTGDRRLEAGDSLCLAPGTRHRIDPIPGIALRICAVHFLGPHAGEAPPFLRRFADLPFALTLMRRVIRAPDAGAPFLAALLAERERQAAAPPDAWWRQLEALCIAILERPQDGYAVAALARRFHCSAEHLSRRFAVHAGLPLSAFVIAARIARARQLLTDSDLPVKTIAAQCGYASVHFFSRQFRQHTGTSPSAMRAGLRWRSGHENP